MRFGTVPLSQVAATGRMDVKFNLLLAEHALLVEELVAKFDAAELTQLALDLPFDQAAVDAVFWRLHPHTPASLREKVDPKPKLRRDLWGDELPPEVPKPRGVREDIRWRTQLAVYCAAAAQFSASKLAEQLLALAQQKLAVVKHLHGIVTVAKGKGAEALLAAIRRDAKGGYVQAPDPGPAAGPHAPV